MKKALDVVVRTRPAINQSTTGTTKKSYKKEVVRSSYLQ
jgi:hypothetical protein